MKKTIQPATAYLGAALVLLVTGPSCSTRPDVRADRLLQSAFSRQRNLELRLPDVGYAEIVAPGAETTGPLGSPELAEAEAIILRQTSNDSPMPVWLARLSRVHLLRGNWDHALDAVRAAYDTDPGGSVSDLGIARLARGVAQRRPRDLQAAVEHLSEALSRNASDPVSLFNRAVAFEKLFLFHRAVADCEAYLNIDVSSGWAGEVRQRLSRVQRTLAAWRSKHEWFHASEDVYLRDHLKAPAELFLDSALTEWLPRLADPDPGRASKARQALTLLGQHLFERHQDTWLNELLARPEPASGLRALAEAIRANRDARRDEGLRHARDARRLFESRSNFAGSVRARLEEIYALSRGFRLRDCQAVAASVNKSIKRARYQWIQGQLLLEQSVCALHEGRLESALKQMQRTVEQIASTRYESLFLRAQGLQASFHTLLGNTQIVALADWRGLDLFWKGIHPPGRAYQFYSDLFLAAERENNWRTAHAFAKEAVDAIALGPNRLAEAMARTRLAVFALRTGGNTEALQQTELATKLLRPFVAMPSAREYRLENQIVLASAYLGTGEVEKAAETLNMVVPEEHADSFLTRVALHRTYGLLYDRKQNWKQARQEFLTAADVSWAALRRLGKDASRLQWKRETDLVFRRLAHIALEHETKEIALALWEWFRSAPVRNRRVPPPDPITLADILPSQLSSYTRATVISWIQIDNRLGIWVFDDRGVQFAWSPAQASHLKLLCSQFSRLCARPDSNIATLRRVGQELYALLIAPIAGHLNSDRILLIEPDTVPGAIAFEALVNPDGRWFGEHFTMITSPGLWAEIVLRRGSATISSSAAALVVGNPSYIATGSTFLLPLPDAEREAQIVTGLFPSGRSLTGAAATSTAVSSALSGAELFHFTGHARFDGETAKLALAGEAALLDSEVIEKSAKNCRLAVLSACSTAASERNGPWNVESLVQAFWRAGTPHVIASRWEVDATFTAQLFVEFYKHLLRGDTAPESLRRAAAAIRGQPSSTHPFFWAAFHVFGACTDREETIYGTASASAQSGVTRHLGN